MIEEADRGSSSNLILLRLAPSRHGIWLGPAWATLCGTMASGQLSGNWQDLFRLLLAIVLMDPLLNAFGCAWNALEWSSRDSGRSGLRSPIVFPYVEARSPGLLVQRWLHDSVAWWRQRFWPRSKSQVISVFLTATFMVGVALSLGSDVLTLVFLGWILMIAQARMRDHASVKFRRGLLTLSAIGLPWFVGQLSFGVLTWPSVILAICSMVAYLGWSNMGDESRQRDLWITAAAQLGIVMTLVYLKHPLAAGLVVLALLPQMLIGMGLREVDGTVDKAVQISLMAGILIGALAVG